MNGWKQISKTTVAMMPRTGWIGVWDSLVSAVTGKPRYTEETTVTASLYVKSEHPVKLEIWGEQVEIGK